MKENNLDSHVTRLDSSQEETSLVIKKSSEHSNYRLFDEAGEKE